MRYATLLFQLFLATVGFAVAADKPANTPQFVRINFPGAATTTVNGINNAGVMVGNEQTSLIVKGFATMGNKFMVIAVPGAVETVCYAVNSSNAIVGFWAPYPGHGNNRGFLYQNGTFTDIGPGDSSQLSEALGINDAGQIVGEYSTDNTTYHGFLYDGATYETLDVPGAASTEATGINNKGQIVLEYQSQDGFSHGAVYDGTAFANIDVPGAIDSYPSSINTAGDVAFSWYDSNGVSRAAVLHGGQYYKFMVPNSGATLAYGINDKDVVVGAAYWNDGTEAGYKLIP